MNVNTCILSQFTIPVPNPSLSLSFFFPFSLLSVSLEFLLLFLHLFVSSSISFGSFLAFRNVALVLIWLFQLPDFVALVLISCWAGFLKNA